MSDESLPGAEGTRSSDLLLERLLRAHEAYYDVTHPFTWKGRDFAGFAEFRSDQSQYVLIKRAKLWEAHTHEYLFFHQTPHLDIDELEELVAFITDEAIDLVDPEPNHMTSYLSLVILANSVDDQAQRALRKTRFRKNLRWGLEGWIDMRLAVVALDSHSVTTNCQGKALKATLEANLNA